MSSPPSLIPSILPTQPQNDQSSKIDKNPETLCQKKRALDEFSKEFEKRQSVIKNYYNEPWKVVVKDTNKEFAIQLSQMIEKLIEVTKNKNIKIKKFQFAGSVVPCLIGPKAFLAFLRESGRTETSIPDYLKVDEFPYPSDADCRIFIEGECDVITIIKEAFCSVMSDWAEKNKVDSTALFDEKFTNGTTHSIQFDHPEKENRVDIVFMTEEGRHAIFPFQDLIIEKKFSKGQEGKWELISPQWNDRHASVSAWCDKTIDLDYPLLNADELNHKVWSLLKSYSTVKGYSVKSVANEVEKTLMTKALLNRNGIENIHWKVIEAKAYRTKTHAVACGLQGYIDFHTLRPDDDISGLSTRWKQIWWKIETSNIFSNKEFSPLAKALTDAINTDDLKFDHLIDFFSIAFLLFPNQFQVNKGQRTITLPLSEKSHLPTLTIPHDIKEACKRLLMSNVQVINVFHSLINIFSKSDYVPSHQIDVTYDDDLIDYAPRFIGSKQLWKREIGQLLIMKLVYHGRKPLIAVNELVNLANMWQSEAQLNFWSQHLFSCLLPHHPLPQQISLDNARRRLNQNKGLTVGDAILLDIVESNKAELKILVDQIIETLSPDDDIYSLLLQKIASYSPQRSLKHLEKRKPSPVQSVNVATAIKQSLNKEPSNSTNDELNSYIDKILSTHEIKVALLTAPLICPHRNEIIKGVSQDVVHNAIKNLFETFTETGSIPSFNLGLYLQSIMPSTGLDMNSFINRTFSPKRDENKKRAKALAKASMICDIFPIDAINKIVAKVMLYAPEEAIAFVQVLCRSSSEISQPIFIHLFSQLPEKPLTAEAKTVVNICAKNVIGSQSIANALLLNHSISLDTAQKMNTWLVNPAKRYINRSLQLDIRKNLLNGGKVNKQLLTNTIYDLIREGQLNQALEVMINYKIDCSNTWMTFFKSVNKPDIAEQSINAWTNIVKGTVKPNHLHEDSRITLVRVLLLCRKIPDSITKDFLENTSWIHKVFTEKKSSAASKRAIEHLWVLVQNKLWTNGFPEQLQKAALLCNNEQKWNIILNCPIKQIDEYLPFLQLLIESLFDNENKALQSLNLTKISDTQGLVLKKLIEKLPSKFKDNLTKSLGRLALMSNAGHLISNDIIKNPLSYLAPNSNEAGGMIIKRFYQNPPDTEKDPVGRIIFIKILTEIGIPEDITLNFDKLNEKQILDLISIHQEAKQTSYLLINALSEKISNINTPGPLAEKVVILLNSLQEIPSLDPEMNIKRASMWDKLVSQCLNIPYNICIDFIHKKGALWQIFNNIPIDNSPWQVKLKIFCLILKHLTVKERRTLDNNLLSLIIDVCNQLTTQYDNQSYQESCKTLNNLILGLNPAHSQSLKQLPWEQLQTLTSRDANIKPELYVNLLKSFDFPSDGINALKPILKKSLKTCTLTCLNKCFSELGTLNNKNHKLAHFLISAAENPLPSNEGRELTQTITHLTKLTTNKHTQQERQETYRIFNIIRGDKTVKHKKISTKEIYNLYTALLKSSIKDLDYNELNEISNSAYNEYELEANIEQINENLTTEKINTQRMTDPFHSIVNTCLQLIREIDISNEKEVNRSSSPFQIENDLIKNHLDDLSNLNDKNSRVITFYNLAKRLTIYNELTINKSPGSPVFKCIAETIVMMCKMAASVSPITNQRQFSDILITMRKTLIEFINSYYPNFALKGKSYLKESYEDGTIELEKIFEISLDYHNRRVLLFAVGVYLSYFRMIHYKKFHFATIENYMFDYLYKLFQLSDNNCYELESDLEEFSRNQAMHLESTNPNKQMPTDLYFGVRMLTDRKVCGRYLRDFNNKSGKDLAKFNARVTGTMIGVCLLVESITSVFSIKHATKLINEEMSQWPKIYSSLEIKIEDDVLVANIKQIRNSIGRTIEDQKGDSELIDHLKDLQMNFVNIVKQIVNQMPLSFLEKLQKS